MPHGIACRWLAARTDKHHVVAILASESADYTVLPLLDLLPSGFAGRVAGTDDVRGDLGNVSSIFPLCGTDDRNSFANQLEEVLDLMEFGLVRLAVSRMVAVAVGSEVSDFVDDDVPEGRVAAIGLEPVNMQLHFGDTR